MVKVLAKSKLSMPMRALLGKLDETRRWLTWTYGSGFVIKHKGTVLFWTPATVRDEALAFGFIDDRGRITALGRAALVEDE